VGDVRAGSFGILAITMTADDEERGSEGKGEIEKA